MPEKRASGHPHPFRVIVGPLIAAFVGVYSEAAMNIALPDLMTVFSVSAAVVQWLTTGYLLAVGILLPLFGVLVRWLTTRQLLVLAAVCFLAGAVLSGAAVSFPMLAAGRIVQGMATGILLPLIFNTAIAVYPVRRRGTAIGMIGLVVMFAPAISPVIAGLILQSATWNWIFWLMIPVLVVALVVSMRWLENVRPITRPRVDVASIVMSTLGFGGVVLGLGLGGDNGWVDPVVLGSLIVGVLGVAGFSRRQLRLAEPMLDVRPFRHRNFLLSSLIIVGNNAMLMCAIFLIPMYLQNARSVAVVATGLLMLPGGALNGVFSAASGRVADVASPRVMVRCGLAIAIMASLLLMTTGEARPLWWIVLGHCLLMVGISLANAPTQTLGLNALPLDLASDGSTILSTLAQIGGAVGTALGASLLSAGERATAAGGTAAVAAGVGWGFAFSLGMACAGLVCSLLISRREPLSDAR
ncbi:DHA2 family efflux MFS transporter permease subunit [Brooklawnia cerclae]|nr:DHA2 family efflux MFS transporter permease subunit [Brooklawnia cerclae]